MNDLPMIGVNTENKVIMLPDPEAVAELLNAYDERQHDFRQALQEEDSQVKLHLTLADLKTAISAIENNLENLRKANRHRKGINNG